MKTKYTFQFIDTEKFDKNILKCGNVAIKNSYLSFKKTHDLEKEDQYIDICDGTNVLVNLFVPMYNYEFSVDKYREKIDKFFDYLSLNKVEFVNFKLNIDKTIENYTNRLIKLIEIECKKFDLKLNVEK